MLTINTHRWLNVKMTMSNKRRAKEGNPAWVCSHRAQMVQGPSEWWKADHRLPGKGQGWRKAASRNHSERVDVLIGCAHSPACHWLLANAYALRECLISHFECAIYFMLTTVQSYVRRTRLHFFFCPLKMAGLVEFWVDREAQLSFITRLGLLLRGDAPT